jgi:hypothetical protein
MPRCAMALRSRFQNGTVVEWHGRGMACVNQKRPHCVNQMGETQSKRLAARHGRGTAWYVCISLLCAYEFAQSPSLWHQPRFLKVTCAWSWRLCGINYAIGASPPYYLRKKAEPLSEACTVFILLSSVWYTDSRNLVAVITLCSYSRLILWNNGKIFDCWAPVLIRIPISKVNSSAYGKLYYVAIDILLLC